MRSGLLRKAHPQEIVFHSLVDPQAAIKRLIAEHNKQPNDPKIIAARNRGFQTVESIH
jgi:hypothetical protein